MYFPRKVHIIDGMIYVMQNKSLGHASAQTIEEFRKRIIESIPWPTYSQDLKATETNWKHMKDYIQAYNPSLDG